MTATYAPTINEGNGFLAGVSGPMQTLDTVINEIAPTDIPLLLVGESGTGKEVFARRIHRLSRRSGEPFRRIACASMDGDDFLSEIGLTFPGAGNGASEGGTLLLDEVAELNAACQRILVNALPDGAATQRPHAVGSRVISTTNRNLDDEMSSGNFRSELYYRINGVCLRLPPLRERKEDIPLFVEFFLTKHASQLQRPRVAVGQGAMTKLLDYSWPGNIRELENVVKQIVVLADEDLALSGLSQPRTAQRDAASPSHSLKAAAKAASREAERELILKALARTRWNRKRAAQELQISYKSLLYKLKQIGFPDSETN
jgi:two-component system response regulator AtoC